MVKRSSERFIVDFGKNLKRIRLEKGMSQERLAVLSNVSFNQVGRIERGEIEAKLTMVKRLADGLELEVVELFDFR